MIAEAENVLRKVTGVGVRRWRWLVLGLGLAAIWGSYRYLSAPRIYQAKSQVVLSATTAQILGRRVESVSDPTAGRWTSAKYLKTQHKLMAGVDMAEAVSRPLGFIEISCCRNSKL